MGSMRGRGRRSADASGNGNNGTLANTTWAATGKYGKALQFNGTSSLVTIPDAASLHLSTGLTLEAWVNPSTVNATWRDVIYKGNDNYYLEGTSTNASRPDAGLIAGGSYADAYGTAALTANTWTYLAETYDGTTLRLYVNGTQVASAAHTGAIASSTNPLQIGGDSIYGQYFAGLIDNVRVYNVALTATQIQTDQTTPITPTGPDTQAPTQPGTLSANAISATEVDLAWGASTDNVGVTGYQLERCSGASCTTFAQIATPTATSYKDTAVVASTSYSYRVRATDAAGNLSTYTNTASATTPTPDTQAPTQPGTLSANAISATEVDLAWGASTDNVGVTGYQLERCSGASCTTFAQIATPTATSYKDTAVVASTSYSYRVRATDAAGNLSTYTNTASATTPTPDTQAPTQPGTLSATAVSATEVDLAWGAATDNVGVTGYQLERCSGASCTTFAQIATPTATSYKDTAVAASTSYSYRVRATDAAGNLSPYTNTASASTPAAPAGLVAAYGFDEGSGTTVSDASGNGNNGTLANTTWAATGKYGKALQFNGTSALVTIPDAASLHLSTGHDAGGLGQPLDRQRHLARRDLQGQRQLLPRRHLHQRLPARRRPDRRRQLRRRLRHRRPHRQHLDVPRRDLRRHHPPPLRQRHPGRLRRPHRRDRQLDQPAPDRRRQHLRPVLRRPDRQRPRLQRRPHRHPDPNRPDNAGGRQRPVRSGNADRKRGHDGRDRPRVGRRNGRQRRYRLPGRTLQRRQLHHLRPDRHPDRHQLQGHRCRCLHQLQLPRPRSGQRGWPRSVFECGHGVDCVHGVSWHGSADVHANPAILSSGTWQRKRHLAGRRSRRWHCRFGDDHDGRFVHASKHRWYAYGLRNNGPDDGKRDRLHHQLRRNVHVPQRQPADGSEPERDRPDAFKRQVSDLRQAVQLPARRLDVRLAALCRERQHPRQGFPQRRLRGDRARQRLRLRRGRAERHPNLARLVHRSGERHHARAGGGYR